MGNVAESNFSKLFERAKWRDVWRFRPNGVDKDLFKLLEPQQPSKVRLTAIQMKCPQAAPSFEEVERRHRDMRDRDPGRCVQLREPVDVAFV